jgi:transcription antitermination factor NusG
MLTNWGKKLGKRLMKPRLKPAPEKEPQRWNIVRGDKVQVIQGPQTGQKGKVLAILRDSCRVIVEGVNLVSFGFLR